MNECVVLLHGLARTADSMRTLDKRLSDQGYTVVNVNYPSRKHPIEALAEIAVGQGIAACEKQSASKIHFVTHSLGGILVRFYLTMHQRDDIGRVVMLGPPNQGSEVADKLKHAPGYELINGPAGMQLGTASNDIPKLLGLVDFQLGVIAGTQSINLLLSTMLPGKNDGKVSVESAKVKGMQDFISLPVTHPFIMKNAAVIEQTIYFLKHGCFNIDESMVL
ncbi:MAG: alpha/beta hydrolase [Zetaproteobacteria bacterium CG_4_9_14_3_um_filter_49_83]|nr:MAG: alpha/beta hydrolase [Zetaproteobacteria bacterium CG1_02_49_23]PIQ31005.1 MAG: alpha/beta hydrolase [Zetaproteobacteria bacterium CG17_big_fil_post_rev_8_21_14_2_50_50_13]PIY56890.1 MAG: alpha/beta hydrolase [Zetaproteobacteria bacterium CG_4_10_14_0_8_um_filter_49_80]PJA35854.1 MAG: alpha/beta hydrolase [Zetaproteobacteria bacterium CG_4_9_14_3_um_filter_49_83]